MPKSKPIMMRYDMRMEADSDAAEIMIYGEINGFKWDDDDESVITARDFDKLIKEAKAKGAKTLNMRINSPGGSVYQAVAMKAMVENGGFDHVNVAIEGLCASAATLLCCVDGSHVTISEGSYFMIHNPSLVAWGTAKDIMKKVNLLEKMEEDFSEIYAKRCKKDKSQCRAMMDEETWMTAKEAVENGFCDDVSENAEIAAMVMPDMMTAMKDMYRNTPPGIGTMTISKADTGKLPDASEDKEEDKTMDIKTLTMDQLKADNPDLIKAAIEEGAKAERQRLSDIDALTPAGYEEMASQAKENGTSAFDYHMQIVAAQREKGSTFMAARKTETAMSATIKGGATDDSVSDDDELKAYVKEMTAYAAQAKAGNESMF